MTRQPAVQLVRRSCRACPGRLFNAGFAMDPMPLAAAYAESAAEARELPRYPLTWGRCDTCTLVQVLEDIPDAELFATYRYAASTVPALVRHHRRYAEFLRHRFGYLSRVRLLEIGCNDGVLLRQLPATWELVGVDPSDIAAQAAAGTRAWRLVNAPVEQAELAGRFDIITSSNAMAHFTRLADAFQAAAELLADDGELWVEVHDLDATLESGRWDTIYHEHKAEWSSRSLVNVARRHGLAPLAIWREPLHGGLLRAGFTRSREYVLPVELAEDFGELVDRYLARQAEFDAQEHRYGTGRLVAYGAAASAVVWLNQMPDAHVEFVVDDSPLRQGRFIPGRGLPIVDRGELRPDDRVIITAASHAADIIARNPQVTRWLMI